MLTDDQLKDIMILNLNNFMIYPIQFFLKSLIDRGDCGTSISRYRLKFNGAYITTWDDLLDKIHLSNLHIDYGYRNDRFPTVTVQLVDINVELDKRINADMQFIKIFGDTATKIMFDIANMYDADLILPLKISKVHLI